MTDTPLSGGTPQFGTAEYKSSSDRDSCKSCGREVTGQYYRVNGSLACESCTAQVQAQVPKDTHAAFVRAMTFGVGGAIVGLGLYATFGIVTGLEIGYISLAVGYIVGKAIKKGSNGVGGRRYQVAGVLLTYAAVSMASIPLWIHQVSKEKAQSAPIISQDSTSTSAQPSAGADSGAVDDPEKTSRPSSSNAAQPRKMGLGAALGMMALLGLASPFLELQDPVHGVIGLIILFVGIQIAWKLTAAPRLDIVGPFSSRPPTSAG